MNANGAISAPVLMPVTNSNDGRGRVEDGRGSLRHAATLRFPSPLIEPDVRISRIRLSDWLHREAHETNHCPQVSSARCALFLRLTIQLSLKDPDDSRCLQAHRQSPSPCLLPTPADAAARSDVEAATLAPIGSPPITRTAFPTCRAHYPGGSSGCVCRLLPPHHAAFPKWQEGRHPHCHFRGLLRLHSRYGPSDRSATQGDLCHEAPVPPVTQRNRSSASGPIDNYPGGTLLH